MCDTNVLSSEMTPSGLSFTDHANSLAENNLPLKKESGSPLSSVYMESESEKSQQMEIQEKFIPMSLNKKKYHNIPNNLRLELIDSVENKGEKIKHVAKRLSINYSSAKSICQVFKKEGRRMKKSTKNHINKEDDNSNIDQPAYNDCVSQMGSNFTLNGLICPKVGESSDSSYGSSDTLSMLKNRLIQNRNNSNTSEERLEYLPYKKITLLRRNSIR